VVDHVSPVRCRGVASEAGVSVLGRTLAGRDHAG
jgi:hypothetical protein